MEKALSIAYRFLSFRPRTIAETEKYLQKKALKYLFTEGEIQAALEILQDQGYLNDIEFIKSFVTSRNSLKPKSKRVLEMELKKLGISQADLDTYFSENTPDENALAEKALARKMKSLLFIQDEKKRFMKAVSFLQRRGFSYEVSKESYNKLLGK